MCNTGLSHRPRKCPQLLERNGLQPEQVVSPPVCPTPSPAPKEAKKETVDFAVFAPAPGNGSTVSTPAKLAPALSQLLPMHPARALGPGMPIVVPLFFLI